MNSTRLLWSMTAVLAANAWSCGATDSDSSPSATAGATGLAASAESSSAATAATTGSGGNPSAAGGNQASSGDMSSAVGAGGSDAVSGSTSATGAGGTTKTGAGGSPTAGAGGSSGTGTGGSPAAGAGGSSGTGTVGSATAGAGGSATAGAGGSSGTVSVFAGALATGIAFHDDHGDLVNAHGGGINLVGDTFYLSGEYFVYSASATYEQNNSFHAFAMYSSKDLVNWTFEKKILPQQPSGELGPNRNGERPHIIKCPSTGEYVLYAHAASLDYQTDKEVVYATSATINGDYAYKGPLTNASGVKAVHSDMSAFVDSANVPYVITESGHVYKLAADCHSWLSDNAYGAMNGMESPAAFKADSTYFWIMSNKTGYRANDNEYATAPSMMGPWTNQGLVAPAGAWTWISQSTFVLPVVGTSGTTYVYWGDHWQNADDQTGKTTGKNNSLATLVVQPLVIQGGKASMPKYLASWKLDIAKGTWSE